jgi:hypothetical protein
MRYSMSRWSQLCQRAIWFVKQCQGCVVLAEVHRRRTRSVRPNSVVMNMEMMPELHAQFGSASGVSSERSSSSEGNSLRER